MNATDWIGSIGVTTLLVAYLLNLLGKAAKESFTYIFLNIAGAGLACMASVMLNYIPFIILEAAWTLISVVAFFQKIFTSTK